MTQMLRFAWLMMIVFIIFFMNNIPVAQLQIASLVEELLSLREGSVTFHCSYFLSEKIKLLFCWKPFVLSDEDETLKLNNSRT